MANCSGTPVSTRIGYTAIKKEATPGTAVKPTTFIPTVDGTIEINKTNLFSTSKLGTRNMNGEGVQGPEEVSGEFSSEFSANYSPWFLYGAMGAISSTDISSLTDGSVYRHDITSSNCQDAFTIEEAQGRYDDTGSHYQNFIVKRSYGVKFGDLTLYLFQLLKVHSRECLS